MSNFLLPLVLVLVLALVGYTYYRRRRARQSSDETAPVPISASDTIDYTSLEIQEPTTWRDRLEQMPMRTRILAGVLLVLVPIALIALLLLALNGAGPEQVVATPVPVYQFSDVDAVLARPDEIAVTARTDLPEGTEVAAELTMDDQPFAWFTDESATTTVRNGRIDMVLKRDDAAPLPKQGAVFKVILSDNTGNTTTTGDVDIVPVHSNAFFGIQPTALPTPRPTQAPPTQPPLAEATPAPVTVEPGTGSTLTATVFNGGNVREQPGLQGRIVGGINAGEIVTLTEKLADQSWYFITTIRGERGWSSATLLTVPNEVAAQVPLQGQSGDAAAQATPVPTLPSIDTSGLTATVFNGGNVREQPNLSGRVVGGINAGELVTLLQKTSSGQWYRLRTVRGEEGWASVSLLTVTPEVRDKVPVAGAAPPTDATSGSPLSASVFNGGNVREQPNTTGRVVGGINAGEAVTLVQKTLDASWYRIRTVRGEEGWVSATLLTVAPAIAVQVPVAN